MGMCVIYNPAAARGRATGRVDELRRSLGDRAEFWPTAGGGDAEILAAKAVATGFTDVAAAGGDGTVHEVANGLLKSSNRDATLVVLPIGSANDYAFCLGRSAVSSHPEPIPSHRLVDVGRVQTADGRERYFINTIGLGFSNTVTEEARRIGWLQGMPLYVLAFLRSLCFRYAATDANIAFDDFKRAGPTFSLTVAIGTREGNLLLTPEAIPDDGLFDYLHAGRLSRFEILRYLPRVSWGGRLPSDHPELWMGRCRAVRMESAAALGAHLDGDLFIRPADGVKAVVIELLPKHLRVRVGATSP
jgi:diacylglycerol kinase family enzyme